MTVLLKVADHRMVSVEELIAIVEAQSHWSERTRTCRRSLLRTFARVVGIPPDLLKLDVASLQAFILKASPGSSGVSNEYWKLVVSVVWMTMGLAGFPVLPKLRDMPEEWRPLLSRLPPKPYRVGVTPLVRAAIALDLVPADINQEAVGRLREVMRSSYTRTGYSRAYRRSIAVWQLCQRDYPDVWPQQPIQPVYEELGYTLGWSAFRGLEEQVDDMLCAAANPVRRRATRPVAVSPTTATQRKYAVLRIASVVAIIQDVPTETMSLTRIATADALEQFIDFSLQRGNPEKSGDLASVCAHVIWIAKHHLKIGSDLLEELRNIRRSVLRPKGPSAKNKKLLLQFRSSVLRERFLRAPQRVVSRLQRRLLLSNNDRSVGMLAAAVHFLQYAPLRLSELTALEFGKHIIVRGGGIDRRAFVHIHEGETKTGIARDFPLASAVLKSLEVAREQFRSDKMRGSSFVFPGADGGRRARGSFSAGLARLISREIGVRMTPHQFRHVIGYIFLLRNPGQYETVRKLLGHSSVRTTITYYAFMLEDEAFERLDQSLNLNDLELGWAAEDGGRS